MPPLDLLWLALPAASFLAGLADAIAGGGGLIQLPALFALMPQALPATLIATNKVAAAAGTAGAAVRYARAEPPPWRMTLLWAGCAFALSAAGAYALTLVPPATVRRVVPVVILAVLVFSAGARLGEEHAPRFTARMRAGIGAAGTAIIGLYDGLLGPGAGTFYQLLFVRTLGFDFLHAAAPAKICNLASNLAAILVLAIAVPIPPILAAAMAAANYAGGRTGSRLALLHGNRFVHRAFLVVAAALVVKTLRDAWSPTIGP
jgi:uncharacterized membrane protein YfcA